MDPRAMLDELKELIETEMSDLDDLEMQADALMMIGELEDDITQLDV